MRLVRQGAKLTTYKMIALGLSYYETDSAISMFYGLTTLAYAIVFK